jgi:hypothetical protein
LEAFIEILEETPWWVYIIFAYLLIVGFKASHRRRIPFGQVFFLPALLALWSFYGLTQRWQGNWFDAGYWIIALSCGAFLGWWLIRHWHVHVDREHHTITLPGTWMTLILALLIFAIRYSFGFYYATHPKIPHPVFIADLLVSGIITGIFIGRALNLWNRYQNA